MRWEHWRFKAPLRLRSILRRNRVEQELDEELRFHLENKIEEGIAQGLTRKEARYRALRAMDGLDQRKEEMRDMRGMHWLTDFADDARYAFRTLRRTPGLAAAVALTLALGIGATSATLSMLDALIFKPYPVPQPSGVMTLVGTTHENSFDRFSYSEYQDIRKKSNSYGAVMANANMGAVGFSAEAGAPPRVKGGMMVSGDYFQALGVQPRLGRAFREEEDQVPGRDAVMVLGPAFWRQEFASDAAVLGRRVRLNGKEFTIIGVAPETFTGMSIFDHPDFYTPLAMAQTFSTNRAKNFFEDRDDRELHVSARLKPGATIEQAQNELAVLAKNFESEYPKTNRGRGAALHTQFEMRTRPDDGNWKFAVIFTILGLAVLLVACTNVAGLLLSRARTRKHEIAIRLAIGAGRFRLIRLLLTESLILASLGGLAGIGIGYLIVAWFHTFQSVIFMTDLPMTIPFQMDTRILLASLVLTALSGLVCGVAPALQSTRTDLVSGLKSADMDVPVRRRLWGRNALVVAQVAMSLMMLTAAFVMVKGFKHDMLNGARIAKDHLLMTSFDLRMRQYDAVETQRFYKLLAERMRVAPGVRSAALTENIPFGDDFLDGVAFVPEGFDMPRDRENFSSALDTVNDGYFETVGIPILRGRGFRASDTSEAPRVAVVNEQFAKHYWPAGDAVGQHLRLESRTGTPVEVVGVARNISYLSSTDMLMDFVYLPLAQHPVARMTLLARSIGEPLQLVGTARDVVRRLDANLPMLETGSYEDFYVNKVVKGPGIAIDMVSGMGAVGLLLAIGGLYGLVAYNVSRRTREIGIRMALGAARADVLRLVMRKGLVLVGIGTVIGVGLGFALERFMNAMLFNAGGVDVWAYLIVVPSMLLVTMLAAYVPARRASRIEPTRALRYE